MLPKTVTNHHEDKPANDYADPIPNRVIRRDPLDLGDCLFKKQIVFNEFGVVAKVINAVEGIHQGGLVRNIWKLDWCGILV